MQNNLVVKRLILDDISLNDFFYQELFKEFKHEQLSIYLSKYLTFWLQQKNTEGPYFLDYFQDYSNSYWEKWGATCNDVKNYGSDFSHEENAEMNYLPKNRNRVGVVKFLGEQVKFEKINHFFNFISFLNLSTSFGDEKTKVIDEDVDYRFLNLPNKIVLIFWADYESSFFHLDFDRSLKFITSKNCKKTNQDFNQVIKDFILFLKSTEVEILYSDAKLKTFYKVLDHLKLTLLLDLEEKNSLRESISTISNHVIIEYINQFLKILKKSLYG